MSISGEKSEKKEDKDRNYHYYERRFGKFERAGIIAVSHGAVEFNRPDMFHAVRLHAQSLSCLGATDVDTVGTRFELRVPIRAYV